MKRWIVVADQSRTRLFTCPAAVAKMAPVETLSNQAAAEPSPDAAAEAPAGRGRHDLNPAPPPAEHALGRYVRHVASYLEDARKRGHFERLDVVAGPHLLGMLRKEMSPPTLRCVRHQVAKDLAHEDVHGVREHVEKLLSL